MDELWLLSIEFYVEHNFAREKNVLVVMARPQVSTIKHETYFV